MKKEIKEIEKLIQLADKEILEWEKFKKELQQRESTLIDKIKTK